MDRCTFRPALVVGLLCVALAAAGCGGEAGGPPDPDAAAGVPPEGGAATPPAGEGGAGAAAPLPEMAVAPEPEKVVAEVNGTPIRQRKVYQVAAINKMTLQAQGQSALPDDAALRRAALDLVIADELLAQAARAAGITITPQQVETEMQSVRTKLGSEEAYRRYIKEAGMDEAAVRAEAERRLLTRAYVKSLTKGAALTETEARSFYEANKRAPAFARPEEVRASVVVVRSDPEDPPAKRQEARARIEQAHQRAMAGGDFAALAREYSQIPNAAKGGDLGFFGKGIMFPKLEEVAFTSPVGKISPIFETPTGFNFLKVTDKKPASVRGFDEVKHRLMMEIGAMKESGAVQAKLDELKARAKIRILDPALQPVPAPAAAAGAAPAGAARPAGS